SHGQAPPPQAPITLPPPPDLLPPVIKDSESIQRSNPSAAAAQPPTPAPLGPNPVALAPSAQSQPAVSVEMIGPETASVGLPVSYEIVVRNRGQVPVAYVKVDDELPQAFRYLGGEPKAEFPGERLSWNLGVMEPGSERRI